MTPDEVQAKYEARLYAVVEKIMADVLHRTRYTSLTRDKVAEVIDAFVAQEARFRRGRM